MTSRQPTGRPRPGAKPGATREQIERRERFERARRESLRGNSDGPVVMYGWHTVIARCKIPARQVRQLLATENAARRMSDEGISLSSWRPRSCGHQSDRRVGSYPTPCIRAFILKPIHCPHLPSRELASRWRGVGPRPDYRSAQCRRDLSLGFGLRRLQRS